MFESDDSDESSCGYERRECKDLQCKTHQCEICKEILYVCILDTCSDCGDCYKECECDDKPSNHDRPSEIEKRDALLVSCKDCKVRCLPTAVFRRTVVIRDKEGKQISCHRTYDDLCEKCRNTRDSREKEFITKGKKRSRRLSNSTKEVARLQAEIDTLKKTTDNEKLLLENEITSLNEELKRKRSDEDAETKECIDCNETKPLSMFHSKSNKQNKEGNRVVYLTVRGICSACKMARHREMKKAKLSK